jgi:arylsulfatase A-like enzyme
VDGTTAYTTVYATTDNADDAIAEIGGSEPFFLWLAFLAAHGPLHEPPAHLHSYDLAGLDPNSNRALFGKAIIEAMDSEIGRIMAAIDFTDTTVIFIGDNGTPNARIEPPFDPNHGKFSVYEGGVNVPLIVTGQAVPPASRGQESAALVQATDLFATVLEIAGVPKGTRTNSVSIMGSVIDPSSEGARQTVFAEMFKPNGGPPDPTRHNRAAREAR